MQYCVYETMVSIKKLTLPNEKREEEIRKIGGWGDESNPPKVPTVIARQFPFKVLDIIRTKCNTMYDHLGASVADLRV